jgi:uncharacterized protein YdeI (YjbR/CyaY-like superfamily)
MMRARTQRNNAGAPAARPPTFFASPAKLRAWLEKNHDKASELLVGIYKKDSGKPSVTWPELVDEVLCFGWIDGIRRRVDDESYAVRITPRNPRSNWSAVNIKRVKELTRLGRMAAPGLVAFERRSPKKSSTYSYEQRHRIQLDPDLERRFQVNRKAWEFFQSQPPGYRQLMIFMVMSAKKKETRLKRLDRVIAQSAAQQRVPLI